jgi:ADP-heptose:LPS heptosyltransferase
MSKSYLVSNKYKRGVIKSYDRIGQGISRLCRAGRRERPEVMGQACRNILVLLLDSIGDVLVATPALRELRNLYPRADITCVTGSWSKDILSHNPRINRLLTYNARWLCRSEPASSLSDTMNLIRLLRRKKFDLGIQLRIDPLGLFLLFLAGAKRRIGYGCQGNGFLLTQVVPFDSNLHVLARNLRVIQSLNSPQPPAFNLGDAQLEFPIPRQASAYIDGLLRHFALDRAGLRIGVHPVPGAIVNYWRQDFFAEVGDALVEKYDAHLVFLGASKDQPSISGIAKLMKNPGVSLAGLTDLTQYRALVANLHLLISVDTVARHVAAASLTPVIALLGGVNDEISWGGYGKHHYVMRGEADCAPCFRMQRCITQTYECMHNLKPPMVLETCDQVLGVLGFQPKHG